MRRMWKEQNSSHLLVVVESKIGRRRCVRTGTTMIVMMKQKCTVQRCHPLNSGASCKRASTVTVLILIKPQN
ncbi:unnamed protein product [Gongylonema pulchrum]|uniref:Uncharacterized protein n=1 Tax=Gongylonema pulchrum TaxID=637853 RepID=A0A3P7R8S5_9BILA|nr:unnamed protein product [Gongylonema pulchrum]